MTAEEVRMLLRLSPFRPSLTHVADGDRLNVRHEDFVAVAAGERELIENSHQDDYQVVDAPIVARLQLKSRPEPGRNSR
jgi:hypothetical protein